MFRNELARLHKHSGGPATWIKDLAAVRFYDLNHQANDGTRRKDLPAFLAFTAGKLSKEVFVDLPEEIARSVGGNVVESPQKLLWKHLIRARKWEVRVFR